MKNRRGIVTLLCLLVPVALGLSACEKERPAPEANQTPMAGSTSAVTPGPQSKVTVVALPTQPGGSTGAATDAPVAATPEPLTAPASADSASQPAGSEAEPSSGEYFEYTVAAGDTLNSLSRRFGVSADSIVSLNGITNPNVLVLGSTIRIPGQAPAGVDTAGSAESEGGGTYTVRAGDTLARIAASYGVTVRELQALNGISNPDAIYTGQVLRIPGGGSAPAPAAGERTTYVVQRGDTLFSIAARHGVTTAQLQAANNISNPDNIYAGQVLVIP